MIIFFPYLGFLAHQVMEIVGSQIKVEWMFNMARVIIGLKQCQLGIENLDNIVLITKNWHEDSRSSYTIGEKFKTIEEYLNVEDNLFEKNEILIADFDFFEMWVRLTLEHQVEVDNYEGQTRRISFIPFDFFVALLLIY